MLEENSLSTKHKAYYERRQLLNSIPVAFYYVLPNGSSRNFFFNDSMETITGYSKDEIESDPNLWTSLICPAQKECVIESLSNSYKQASSFETEYSITRKDQSSRYIFDRAHPIFDDKGQIIRMEGIITDLTHCERAEHKAEIAMKEMIKANQKLKESVERSDLMAQKALEANKVKSDFLANVSHEIRTPLNAVLGFTDILASEDLTEKQTQYVSIIQESSQNLILIINDILDFSKIESGQMKFEMIECSLNKIVEGVEALLRPAAKNKGIEFKVIQEDNIPSLIKTDPLRLRQCLINLVKNAIKFTEKGHVIVSVSLRDTSEKQFVCFEIKDTGIGIPKQSQGTIFDPFLQADTSNTRKYGGTGLGLAITKQFTELLGGEITLQSEPTKGSTFTLSIPIATGEVASEYHGQTVQEHDLVKTETPKFRGRVLIAEDSKPSQVLLNRYLDLTGCEVVVANDGLEAVNIAHSGVFDLILMDMQMPKLSGYDAAKRLRQEKYNGPIIALTASVMEGERENCTEAGCDDYLTKPISQKKLWELLGLFLQRDDSATA